MLAFFHGHPPPFTNKATTKLKNTMKISLLKKQLWLAIGTILIAGNAKASLNIEFDYSYDTRGLFTDQQTSAPIMERRALLNTAASFYTGFTDHLTAIAPQAGDHWSVSIGHPSSVGSAVTLNNTTIDNNTIRIYVGGSPSSPRVLGFAGTGYNLSASGSTAFEDAVHNRGQANASGSNASDYGVWGGSIWFNTSHDWHFGESADGLSPGHPDFLTTATHEIGHILGFGEADSWLSQITDGLFTGSASMSEYGSAVPVDQFNSHWAEGTLSAYLDSEQEAMMDPTTPFGERQLPTRLDYAGFSDIGWQVTAVPVPPALWLFGSGLLGLLGTATKKRGSK